MFEACHKTGGYFALLLIGFLVWAIYEFKGRRYDIYRMPLGYGPEHPHNKDRNFCRNESGVDEIGFFRRLEEYAYSKKVVCAGIFENDARNACRSKNRATPASAQVTTQPLIEY